MDVAGVTAGAATLNPTQPVDPKVEPTVELTAEVTVVD